jgi:hypothetical protein
MPKTIVIISTPRSISTALLMSMRSRNDMYVMHEPGLRPYNEALKKVVTESTDFIDHMLKTLPQDFPTYQSLIDHLKELSQSDEKHIFIKEMIFTGREYMEDPFFDNADFFFLVRRPENSLISFYKESKQPMNAAMEPALSYENMFNFKNKLKSMNRKVHILKSEDLIENPALTIQQLCQQAEIQYIPTQISWASLSQDTMMISRGSAMLAGWHDTAKTSNGFNKDHIHHVSCDLQGNPTFKEIPEDYREGYRDFWKRQMPFYQLLSTAMNNRPSSSLLKM